MDYLAPIMVGICLLVLPGYGVARMCRSSRWTSIALAPAISSAEIAIVCIVFPYVGIQANAVSVGGALAFITLVCCGVALAEMLTAKRARTSDGEDGSNQTKLWLLSALSLSVSILIGVFVFLINTCSSDAFVQAFDNVYHINGIYDFLQSGNWSSFVSGFYPSAWRDYVALIVSVTGCSIPCGEIASLFVYGFIAFPLGMLFLCRCLFPNNNLAMLGCALLSVSAISYPWCLITFGPIYPNYASVACIPTVIGLFVLLFNDKTRNRILLIILFIVSLIGVAFLQPNTAFTAAMFLAPFLVAKSYQLMRKANKGRIPSLIVAFVVLAAICCLWVYLVNSSMLSSVMGEPGSVVVGSKRAIFGVITMEFLTETPQVLLLFLVCVGAVWLLRNRKHAWILVSTLLMLAAFVAAASYLPDPWRSLLSGFWYHDSPRLAANCCIPLLLLAYLGFSWIADAFLSLVRERGELAKRVVIVLVSCVCLLLAFLPGGIIGGKSTDTVVGAASSDIKASFNPDAQGLLSPKEKAFLSRVKEIVGDQMVINVPDDGSSLAHSLYRINELYPIARIWNLETEKSESRIIRLGLCNYTTDAEVAQTVKDLNAQYVLMLDQGDTPAKGEIRTWLFTWDWYSDWWDGITSINDDTQGFEVVLADEDMRLYRIVR